MQGRRIIFRRAAKSAGIATPTAALPRQDIGAATQRNFRYQSGYAVVLMCGAALSGNEYKAIWCEQEDDLLAELGPELFDSYQIKTQEPELGAWDTTKEGFIAAIRVFANLERKYPGRIRWFNFVSNTKLLHSNAAAKVSKCPETLAAVVRAAKSYAQLSQPFKKSLGLMATAASCTDGEAFAVLKRLRFAVGPSRDSFIAEIHGSHLSQLGSCSGANSARLRRATFAAIHLFEDAASLSSQHPSRHYACLGAEVGEAQLLAKRVSLEAFQKCVDGIAKPAFRYQPEVAPMLSALSDSKLDRFVKKLNKGGLDHYVDTLRSQALSAEETLLDLVTRDAEAKNDVSHLTTLVKAECDFAHLKASATGTPFGKAMLTDVENRLDAIAKDTEKSCGQPKELLLGLAGLLTEDCLVWWSDKFDVDGES
jgi:hypothetical protein